MKILRFILFILSISITSIYGQNKSCEIPSVISSGEFKLLKSCSPYTAPKTITVAVGAKLTSEPGVEIIMPDSAMITINGTISMVGTEAEPIHFVKASNAKRWLYIYVYKSIDTARFENVIFDDALRAVYSFNSKLLMNKTTGNNVVNFVKAKYGSAKVFNSKINCLYDIGIEIADIIQGVQALMIIDGNYIKTPVKGRKTDAIDLGDYPNCIIRNNIIYSTKQINNSDCIDCDNCHNLLIKNNIICHTYDKGISLSATTLGANNSGIVEGNIVYDCSIGIKVADSSKFTLNHNTFVNNDTNMTVKVGGEATVINTILASARKKNVFVSSSTLNISYSLSDKELFAGTGNIMGDPMFVNSSEGDYSLKSNSPCIDKGDPASAYDPDNTRTDIGALYYNQNKIRNLYLNEFLAYNTNVLQDSYNEYDSWLEIYNANNAEVDLAGLYLSDDINTPLKYKIPQGSSTTKIAAGGYKIFWCDNQTTQGPLHTNFILSHDKVELSLYQSDNTENILIDSISSGKQYANKSYCRYPDGNKYHDYTLLPTPGASNILIIDKIEEMNPVKSFVVFTDATNDRIMMIINNVKTCNAKLKLSDISGRTLISTNINLNTTGAHTIDLFDNTQHTLKLSKGLYLISINTGNGSITKKVIL